MKVALIGNGFIGDAHRNAYKILIEEGKDISVVAICDVRPEMLEKNEFGANAYTNVDEMLQKETELDYVDICVPTYLHKEISIKCMEAGLHVLCEKPMALHTEDAEAMIQCSQSTGKKLMIAQCSRFNPHVNVIRKFIMEGKFGKPQSAFFTAPDGRPTWGFEDWFMDKERSGSAMLDLQAHSIDLVNWLFGMPKYVSTTAMERGDYTGFSSISANMVYGDGLFVHIWCDWWLKGNKHHNRIIRVNFEHGYVLSDRTADIFVAVDEDGNETDLTSQINMPGNSYRNEIEYFITSLEQGQIFRFCAPEETAKVIKIMRAQEKSAQMCGAPVYLD